MNKEHVPSEASANRTHASSVVFYSTTFSFSIEIQVPIYIITAPPGLSRAGTTAARVAASMHCGTQYAGSSPHGSSTAVLEYFKRLTIFSCSHRIRPLWSVEVATSLALWLTCHVCAFPMICAVGVRARVRRGADAMPSTRGYF